MNMNFQPIFNNRNDIVDAQCWPFRVGPKVVGCPEVPVLPLPPVIRACTGGQKGVTMASMGADISGLAREALSKRLEDYQLEAVLGKGSFGCVYRAMDLSAYGHGKKVAIKQISRAKVIGGDREMLFTEKRILSHLTATNSPYFTPLIESFTDPHNFTIVQGLAAGGSLRDAMYNSNTLFRMHEIKFLMAQLCYAVSVMQDHNVIHRDLKPDNILLDEHGRLVIGDFGLGHMFKPTQGTGLETLMNDDFWHRTKGECGTPGYMAPEMLRDDLYSYKVDNFSVGVIFYELVFGRHPFRGRNRSHLDERALFDTPEFPNWFRQNFYPAYTLMRRLLAKNPDHRISMKDAMDSIYFTGVNWSEVAKKTQPVPAGWKPEAPVVVPGAYLSKRILINDPNALVRWRPDPTDYDFVSPKRYRPGVVLVPVEQPVPMPAPTDSPDMREERLAVGRMIKKVLERARKARENPSFEDIPLNEPESSAQAVRGDCDDVEMESTVVLSNAPSQRHRSPYDSRRIEDPDEESVEIILDYGSADEAPVPAVPAPRLSSSVVAIKDYIGEFPAPPAEVARRQGNSGERLSRFSEFNVSIYEIKEYGPGESDAQENTADGQPVFYIQATSSPNVKKEDSPVNLNITPLNTFATNSTMIATPAPLTPPSGDSESTRPGMLLDVNALWVALERQELHPLQPMPAKLEVNPKPCNRPMPAAPSPQNVRPNARTPLPNPPKFLAPIFRQIAGPFAALDKLADLYGVPMELSD